MDSNLRTILLVEDEMIIAQAERMALQQAGYHVIHVASGEDAIAIVGSGCRIDLILMDVHLGRGVDGIDAAAEILRRRTVPVLFLSAYTDAATVERAERVGGYGYAAKGLINTLLLSQIRSTIRLFEAGKREINELREDKRVLKVILDALPAYVWHKDREGRFVHANNAFCAILGASPDEVVGKSDEDFFSAEKAGVHQRNDETIMRTGQALRGIQNTYLAANGEQRFSQVDKVPVFDDHGVVVGTVGLGIDVTALRLIEADLRRSREQYRLALEEKEEILREAHHRIKNNFATVESYLSLQAARADAHTAEQLLTARHHIGSLRSLYERLLESEGKDFIDVGSYLREITAIVVDSEVSTDVQVTANIDQIQLNSKMAYPLGTVAIELLTNCLKHAFVPGTPGTIDLSLHATNGSAVLQVMDNGRGFPQDFNADHEATFGISIVRMFARRLGGSFEVAPAAAGGTCCVFSFPLPERLDGAAAADAAPRQLVRAQPSL